jgi:hypothetical protein
MDLDKLYKLGKTLAVFALTILLISITAKVWCGGCGKRNNHFRKTCAVSPCANTNQEVQVFAWDSDSGEIDIEAIINNENLDDETKELLKRVIKDIDIDIEIDDDGKEVKKKVMVKLIGE